MNAITRPMGEHKAKLFNPTIDVGHVLTALLMLAALVGVWHTLDSRQMLLESQHKELTTRQHEDRGAMQQIALALGDVSRTQVKILTILDGHIREVEAAAKVTK